ncbi:MAG: tyrosine-type recombinase/integrase [Halorhodospira sp.]
MRLPESNGPADSGLAPVSPSAVSRSPATVYLAALAPGSRRSMDQALAVIASELSGDRFGVEDTPWHQVRYEHAQAIRARLAERYAPATANKMLAALRGVLKEAWRLGQMDAETYRRAVDLQPIRGERVSVGREVTLGEAQAILTAWNRRGGASGARDAAAFALLYGGGLRRAEVVGLDLADYDEQEGRLVVRGKGRKERTVYLDDGSEAALQAWLSYRGQEPGPLLSPVTRGGLLRRARLTDSSLYRAIERRRQEAGVAPFTPHDLRRSFGGDLLDAGADLATVQQLMGHSNPQTTARYDRRGERSKRQAARLRHTPFTPAS